ncbi:MULTISPECIES: hypothetical protein [Brachybacterium]|uniref:Uncharacterized protein n=1 Tax=Brachybacterium kimchii TaxID=2942909 RepID=A0ABY4N7N2_9MICO|nr:MULTISPECIES: hypothetical protein [Brachybacterium]MCG7309710.1 hypothetical protein [Brachybacterium sp. ACRRE]UQN30557.1 hypothetical protein M4486_04390 [Brachybacterium kimchii]
MTPRTINRLAARGENLVDPAMKEAARFPEPHSNGVGMFIAGAYWGRHRERSKGKPTRRPARPPRSLRRALDDQGTEETR